MWEEEEFERQLDHGVLLVSSGTTMETTVDEAVGSSRRVEYVSL